MLCLEHPDHKIIGFIVGRVTPGQDDGTLAAEVYNIAVKEREQGKGNGQSLLNAFVDRCREREVCSIWLEVRESNRQAIDFYIRNGFENVQKRPNFYKNPVENAVLMRLKLKT